MLESLNEAVHKTKDAANREKGALAKKLGEMGIEVPLVDVEIRVRVVDLSRFSDILTLGSLYIVVHRSFRAPQDGCRWERRSLLCCEGRQPDFLRVRLPS